MTDRLAIYRTIDKRDRIGLHGVFEALVALGLERWQALAWCYWIAPVAIKKRILVLSR
jgi:hypothetical protein